MAPEAWRRGDLSSVTATINDPVDRGSRSRATRSRRAASARSRAAHPEQSRTVPAAEPDGHGVTGNYVGETLTTTRAHQGDLRPRLERLDQRQGVRPLLVRRVPGEDQRASVAAPPRQPDATRRFATWPSTGTGSSARRSSTRCSSGSTRSRSSARRLDWAGIGDANATFGIAGGQPIAGLSSIGWGGGLTSRAPAPPTRTRSTKTYQFNEKLTWLTGRHTVKFGGQFLHYVQRRFYAGNNGLLGLFNYSGAFTGFAVLRFPARPGGEQGAGQSTDPWTHLHNRMRALRPGRLQGDARRSR